MSDTAGHLKALYETIYDSGKEAFFSRFIDGKDLSETNVLVWGATDFSDKRVVDIGCGTGETAAGVATLGARHVTGIDYAAPAIALARDRHAAPNLDFRVCSHQDWNEPVDVVISCGTLEHMDDPRAELNRMIGFVAAKGTIILTCPYFLNLRGFIWMTLSTLFDVPMSLTDRHFLSPFDIEEWLADSPMQLSRTTPFDYDRANGAPMLVDMRKRLTNALRDAGLPNDRVESALDWFGKVVAYEARANPGRLGGANALYVITPR